MTPKRKCGGTRAAADPLNKAKLQTCRKLKRVLNLDSDEKRLWFAVLAQIVTDLGAWKVLKYTSSGIVPKRLIRFDIPLWNTDRYVRRNNPDFDYICAAVGTCPEYVIKVIRELIPEIKPGYYEGIREGLGL